MKFTTGVLKPSGQRSRSRNPLHASPSGNHAPKSGLGGRIVADLGRRTRCG
jgi:hypothetical protein